MKIRGFVVCAIYIFLKITSEAAPTPKISLTWFDDFKGYLGQDSFEELVSGSFSDEVRETHILSNASSNSVAELLHQYFEKKNSNVMESFQKNVECELLDQIDECVETLCPTEMMQESVLNVSVSKSESRSFSEKASKLKLLIKNSASAFSDYQSSLFVYSLFSDATRKLSALVTEEKVTASEGRPEIKSKISQYFDSLIYTVKRMNKFELKDVKTIESDFPDTISYDKDDESFLGKLIGMMICRQIKPLMSNGNVSAASKEVTLILNDIVTYLGFVGTSVAICATFLGSAPFLCVASIASIGVATLALAIRALSHM